MWKCCSCKFSKHWKFKEPPPPNHMTPSTVCVSSSPSMLRTNWARPCLVIWQLVKMFFEAKQKSISFQLLNFAFRTLTSWGQTIPVCWFRCSVGLHSHERLPSLGSFLHHRCPPAGLSPWQLTKFWAEHLAATQICYPRPAVGCRKGFSRSRSGIWRSCTET